MRPMRNRGLVRVVVLGLALLVIPAFRLGGFGQPITLVLDTFGAVGRALIDGPHPAGTGGERPTPAPDAGGGGRPPGIREITPLAWIVTLAWTALAALFVASLAETWQDWLTRRQAGDGERDRVFGSRVGGTPAKRIPG